MNPYETPRSLPATPGEQDAPPLEHGDFEVDGAYLVATSGAHLPAICVLSCKPIPNGPRLRLRVDATRSFRFVVRRDVCHLNVSIDPKLKWRRRRVLAVLALAGSAAGWWAFGLFGLLCSPRGDHPSARNPAAVVESSTPRSWPLLDCGLFSGILGLLPPRLTPGSYPNPFQRRIPRFGWPPLEASPTLEVEKHASCPRR